MVKGNFKNAVDTILEKGLDNELKDFLQNNPNQYVQALGKIPIKTRKLFISAYQSYLFNKILFEVLKENKLEDINSLEIPLIGFGFEQNILNEKIKPIVKNIIEKEKISSRDFIIRQIPALSSEGLMRNAFTQVKNFEIPEDNLNQKSLKLKFFLEKGSYATTILDFIFNNCANITKDFI